MAVDYEADKLKLRLAIDIAREEPPSLTRPLRRRGSLARERVNVYGLISVLFFSGLLGCGAGTRSESQPTQSQPTPPPPSGPLQLATPQTISFGYQPVGAKGPRRALAVSNPANKMTGIKNIQILGNDADAFHELSNCGAMLSPGASCTIWIEFQPTSAGAASAQLLISDDSATSDESIPLTGVGVLPEDTDIVVLSATPSGIMAAVEAANLGKRVVMLEPTGHVGGMLSSGLGQTDIYNFSAIGGLPREFFRKVATLYGATPSLGGSHLNHILRKQQCLRFYKIPISKSFMALIWRQYSWMAPRSNQW